MSNSFISASGDNRVDALLSGSKWGSGAAGSATTITYSYPSGSAFWSYTEEANAGWSALNSTQQADFTAALTSWQEVTQLTFTEVADSTTFGDIRVAYTQLISGNTQAYAYLPGSGTVVGNVITPSDQAGDVWLNPSVTDLSSGTQGYTTLIHEIGHSLGLKHSFEAESGFPTIDSSLDDTHYTVMSYTDYEGAGFVFTDIGNNQFSIQAVAPTTPMLYDILAAQYLYGTNTTTRTGDDTYTFTTNSELKTIWDAGGTDTIDLSNQLIGANLNLTAGTFSDIGQRQMTLQGPLTQGQDNIAIAFGVSIENAIGSGLDDTITGNSLANSLTGGAGNDTLDGGDGVDTAVFSGNRADYSLTGTSLSQVAVTGTDGNDQISNIEQVRFDDGLFDVATLLGTANVTIPTQQSEVDLTPDENEIAYFLLELSGPLSSAASVSYATRDGTAIAGQDYVATTGTATIAAGSTYVAIAVQLLDDSTAESNETFSLAVSNPVGGIFSNDAIELVAQRTIIDNDTV